MSLRCWLTRRRLVAWIDGELPPPAARGVERHVVDCAECRRRAARLGESIDRQRTLLARAQVPPAVDVAAAWATLWEVAATRESVPRPPVWHPALVGSVATALVVLLAVLVSGRPRVVLVPLGIEAPPHAVAQQPGLYRDLPILERLDALEHFDTVQSVPLEDGHSHSG